MLHAGATIGTMHRSPGRHVAANLKEIGRGEGYYSVQPQGRGRNVPFHHRGGYPGFTYRGGIVAVTLSPQALAQEVNGRGGGRIKAWLGRPRMTVAKAELLLPTVRGRLETIAPTAPDSLHNQAAVLVATEIHRGKMLRKLTDIVAESGALDVLEEYLCQIDV